MMMIDPIKKQRKCAQELAQHRQNKKRLWTNGTTRRKTYKVLTQQSDGWQKKIPSCKPTIREPEFRAKFAGNQCKEQLKNVFIIVGNSKSCRTVSLPL